MEALKMSFYLAESCCKIKLKELHKESSVRIIDFLQPESLK